MRFLKAFVKLFLALTFVFIFVVISSILLFFLSPFPFIRRSIITKLSLLIAPCILKVLNLQVEHIGPPPKSGSIIVSNHMSYLDILVYLHSSCFKCLFISSVDIRGKFFLGQLIRLGGCLYVERRNPKNLHKELKTIKKYFDRGFMICFFPEGTTSDGKTVLPFKKSLFQLAIETSGPIQPVVLNYKTVNGEPFGDKNRDSVCWYSDSLNFFLHLLNLVQLKRVKAQLQVLSPVDSKKFKDRKNLSDQIYRIILEQYHKNLSS